MTTRGAIFLDRDGTIITDEHYLNDPERVRFLPGAISAITRANAADIPVIIVTNQSGIARGIISPEQYEAVASRLNALLVAGGARITATYYSPHAPGTEGPESFRKPGLGMYRQAAREHELDLASSAYIGDKWRDVQPALATGGLGILVPHAGTPMEEIERALLSARTAADIEEAISETLVWMRAAD